MSTDQLTSPENARLGDEAGIWRHYALRFTDWKQSETLARAHLTALLDSPSGQEPSWWFIRKNPCWRVRVNDAHGREPLDVVEGLDRLVHEGVLASWNQGHYEPETVAFGGTPAIAVAHDLFAADAHAILSTAPAAGRRELSLVLCSALMRGAGLEWYERGDAWDRVSSERPLPPDVAPEQIDGLASQIRTLLLADGAGSGFLGGPDLAPWAAAFTHAGRALRELADEGRLERGLRAVLSYHVIFHWNRLGLPARTQAIMSRAARTAVLDAEPKPQHRRHGPVNSGGQDLDAICAAFPLIRQPRLHAGDLASRVEEATDFARVLRPDAPAEQQIENACAVWNLTALIAADCGMRKFAVELCETQFDIFRTAWPLSGRIVIAALQPLVNLIRLTRRSGDPRAAYNAFVALETAVHDGGTTQIHGRSIDLAGFAETPDGLDKAALWLRRVLREDGTRSLMTARAWVQAATHAAAYDAHGHLLCEARQTRIIAHARAGEVGSALAQLDATELTQPWEQAVSSCLRALIHQVIGDHDPREDETVIAAVRLARTQPDRATTSFRTRLALTALDLTVTSDRAAGAALAAEIANDIADFGDSLSARDALAHPTARALMADSAIDALTTLTRDARLAAGTIPPHLDSTLTDAIAAARQALEQALNSQAS